MFKNKFAFTAIAFFCSTMFVFVPSALAMDASDFTNQITDNYVYSNTYIDPNGKIYNADDGLIEESGSIVLNSLSEDDDVSGRTNYSSPIYYRFGSSFASTQEKLQFTYEGTAYASGNLDYKPSGSSLNKRVIEVCFKYTRGSADVIGWQCSKASLGTVIRPGTTVRKTVTDSLGWNDPKTVFRYSYKAI